MHNRPTRRVSGKQLSCGLIHEQAHPNRTGETLRENGLGAEDYSLNREVF